MLSCARVLLLSAALAAAGDPPAMFHARRSYELSKQGDLDRAAAEMGEAISADPRNPLFLTALGGILSRQGRAAEAKECFERALALDPSNAVFRLRLEAVSLDLGAVLAKQSRWRAGLALAEETAKRFPESSPAWQMLGLFRTKNQQNVLAVEAYRRSLQFSPECAECAVGLGIAQSAAGMKPEAARTFEDAVTRWPENVSAYIAYGVLLMHMAETEPNYAKPGLEMLRRALQLDSNSPEPHYQIGTFALDHGDTATAIEHLTFAASAEHAPSKTFYALSRAWRRQGNVEKAAELLKRFEQQKALEQP